MSMGYCAACDAFVPVARQVVGKVIGATIGGWLGRKSKTWWGTLLSVAGTALLGHVVDEAAGAVCGRCGTPVQNIQPA